MPSDSQSIDALDSHPTPTFFVDGSGNVLTVSPALQRLLGPTCTDSLHGSWRSLLVMSERPRAKKLPTSGRWRFQSPSSDGTPCDVVYLPLTGGDTASGVVIVALVPECASVMLETRPYTRAENFQDLAGSFPGALLHYALYPDGTDEIHYVTPGCVEIWEVTAESIEKDLGQVWAMVHPDDLAEVSRSITTSGAGLTQWIHEWRIVTPSGKLKWIQGSGRPRMMEDGGILWNTFIVDVTDRKLHDESQSRLLARSRDQLRSLAAQLQVVREDERSDLARELHDVVGQDLTVMRLDLHEIERSLTAGQSAAAPIAHLKEMLAGALTVIQRITGKLRPPVFEFRGLGAIISTHVADRLDQVSSIQFHVDTERSELKSMALHPDRALALFRIFQESVTNVLRHSKAKEAWIRVYPEGPALVLEVEDNGVGITDEDIEGPLSMGIAGMRERIHGIGGTFSVGAGEHGGVLTRATVEVPSDARSEVSKR